MYKKSNLLPLFIVLLNVKILVARFNRTVIRERDMTRREALSWKQTSHAYARVCGRHGSFGTQAARCPNGVVLKEPFIPECICLRGVWILHTELCKNYPIILIGRKNHPIDCYTVEFKISMLLFLGDVENPFKTKAYVAPQTMTVFHEIPENGSWTPVLDFKYPVIVVINPLGNGNHKEMLPSYEAEEEKECFTAMEVREHPRTHEIVHVWRTALPPTKFRAVKKCTDPEQAGYEEFSTHDNFYFHGSTTTVIPNEGCYEPCPIWPDGRPILMSSKEEDLNEFKTYPEWLEIFRNEGMAAQGLNKTRKDVSDSSEELQNTRVTVSPKRRRKKRKIVNCETVWDGRGFCMKSYWDPLDKFEMSEKHKELCYPSNKGIIRNKLRRYG